MMEPSDTDIAQTPNIIFFCVFSFIFGHNHFHRQVRSSLDIVMNLSNFAQMESYNALFSSLGVYPILRASYAVYIYNLILHTDLYALPK